MKLLILKTDMALPENVKEMYKNSLAMGLTDGVIFLDGAINYEVVEFDSLTLDGAVITDEAELMQKDKESYLARKYSMMNKARKARINQKG